MNPLALELLQRNRISTAGLRSKSWDEFAKRDAPRMDFVFTVCDSAANEECPVWPGQPITAHLGVPDPAAAEGSEDEKRRAFFKAYNQLSQRIRLFVDLPIDKLDRIAVRARVASIGQERD